MSPGPSWKSPRTPNPKGQKINEPPIVMRLLNSNRIALGSLAVLWLSVRIYAMLTTEPPMCLELQQARKLLEYGWSATHGAPLWSPAGRLPEPAAFIYTHHPYLFFWLITAIYAVGGPYGVLLLMTLAKLIGCLLLFKTLDAHVDRFSAWLAALLCAIAPSGILEDFSASTVALSAIIWPIGAWLLLGRKDVNGAILRPPAWLCGILAFAAIQIDWLALPIIPALMSMMISWRAPWRKSLLEFSNNPCVRALAVGVTAGTLLFLIQVLVYIPDLGALFAWLSVKSGANSTTVSKTHLFLLVLVRAVAFVGFPLVLGTLIGCFCRSSLRAALAIAALVHVVFYGLIVAIIPNYFYTERTVYPGLLIPTAILTSVAIQRYRRLLPWLLVSLSLPGLIYAHLLLAVPDFSSVSKRLGGFIAQHSRNTDIVLTNLKPCEPPYAASDIVGGKATAVLADRRVYFGIERPSQVAQFPKFLKQNEGNLVILLARSRPVSPELLQIVRERAGFKATFEVSIPLGPTSLAGKIRAFAWYKIMRKAPPPSETVWDPSATFDIYQMKLEDPVWKFEVGKPSI